MNLADLDAAIVAHLDGLAANSTTVPAALADVPDSGGWQGEPGSSTWVDYIRVDPNPANRESLRLADAHSLHVCEWVVKGVSLVPGRAKAITDAARTALLDTPLAGVPSGLAITMKRHVSTTGPYPDFDTVPELQVSAATVEMAVYKE